MDVKMKKWYILILLLLICISTVKADSLSPPDLINNTYKNITVYIDNTIYFTNLYDNASGIFFDNIYFSIGSTNYTCGDENITYDNYTTNSSLFPLNNWTCSSEIIINYCENARETVFIAFSIIALMVLVGAAFLIINIFTGDLTTAMLMSGVTGVVGVAIALFVGYLVIGLLGC